MSASVRPHAPSHHRALHLAARFAAHARRGLSELGEGALELAWPTRCVGCDAPGALLCDACRRSLPAIDQACACPRCGAPFGRLVCTECTDSRERGRDEGEDAPGEDHLPDALTGLSSVTCFGVLAWPLDAMVRAYKDGGERRLAPLLADLLAAALDASPAGGEGGSGPVARPDALVFVPATARAYARRGFDHMEHVARALARRTGVPLLDALARPRAPDQRDLGREGRLRAAEGGWRVVEPVGGRRVLLVDDVLTTGSTLGGAARVLRVAGAADVAGLCVARAW